MYIHTYRRYGARTRSDRKNYRWFRPFGNRQRGGARAQSRIWYGVSPRFLRAVVIFLFLYREFVICLMIANDINTHIWTHPPTHSLTHHVVLHVGSPRLPSLWLSLPGSLLLFLSQSSLFEDISIHHGRARARALSLSLSLSLSHTNTITYDQMHLHTHTHIHSLTHSLTHTHTHTRTHDQLQTWMDLTHTHTRTCDQVSLWLDLDDDVIPFYTLNPKP
jgi:hypothetical protein